MSAGAAELRHGYTLADLDRLSMVAVYRDFWHRASAVADSSTAAAAADDRTWVAYAMPAGYGHGSVGS